MKEPYGGEPAEGAVTGLLALAAAGDDGAVKRLVPLVYDELRRLAHAHRYRWRDSRAPGTTSLVHEAYLKLVGPTQIRARSRGQFFAVSSRAMRSVLIDNARYFQRQKRDGGRVQVPLEDALLASEASSDELLALDAALARLAAGDARLAQIVEHRIFGGLTIDEIADVLDVSPATVKRGWILARTWLYREMGGDAGHATGTPA